MRIINIAKKSSLAIIIAVVAIVFLFEVNFGFLEKVKELDLSATLAAVISSDVIDLTNKKRGENNLKFLRYNILLSRAAQMKADDMAQRGYFSHSDPDGLLPWAWLDKAGYRYSYAGENLGLNFVESAGLLNAWMNSSFHKLNLLNTNYTEIGIGVATGIYEGKK